MACEDTGMAMETQIRVQARRTDVTGNVLPIESFFAPIDSIAILTASALLALIVERQTAFAPLVQRWDGSESPAHRQHALHFQRRGCLLFVNGKQIFAGAQPVPLWRRLDVLFLEIG